MKNAHYVKNALSLSESLLFSLTGEGLAAPEARQGCPRAVGVTVLVYVLQPRLGWAPHSLGMQGSWENGGLSMC